MEEEQKTITNLRISGMKFYPINQEVVYIDSSARITFLMAKQVFWLAVKEISSKQKIIDYMEANGLKRTLCEKIFLELKETGVLVYSRKKPQGYSVETK